MFHPPDEALAEAAAASPQDANVLEIRVGAADATIGLPSFKKADATFARRLLPLFKRLSTYGPHAALAAGVLGFAAVAGSYFSGGQLPFYAMNPQPVRTVVARESAERAELLRMEQKMAGEIRALRASVEAMRSARSLSAKDVIALEGLKTHLDAVKTETGAAIAELAGKVEHMQRETTAKFSQVSERFDRTRHQIVAPLATASRAVASASTVGVVQKQAKNRRGDAFDPSQNPGAPGVPRPLAIPAPGGEHEPGGRAASAAR